MKGAASEKCLWWRMAAAWWLSSEYHSPQLTDAGSGQSWASGGITGAPTDWTHVRQPLVAGDNNINMYHVKYVLVDLMEQFYFKQKEIWVQITCNNFYLLYGCRETFNFLSKLFQRGCFLGCRSSRNPFNYIYTTIYTIKSIFLHIVAEL